MKLGMAFRVALLGVSLSTGMGAAAFQDPVRSEEGQPKPVRRAKRPVIKPEEWERTYFNNLFVEGLVGPRPSATELLAGAGKSSTPGTPGTAGTAGPVGNAAPAEGAVTGADAAWSDLIDAETLENEIKRVQIALEALVTTPVKFQTDYLTVRDAFSMLSMWMAIIERYPKDVRWKSDAPVAQAVFARTAANCRVGSDAAFNSARNSQELLRELVRGGTFNASEIPIEDFTWAKAVDRNPIMRRLEIALANLKQNTGSAATFQSEIEEVLHDANLIAAMSIIVADPNMDDGDDEGYVEFANQMLAASRAANEAIKLQNYELAAQSINQIEQSCNNCHADWR